MEEFRRKWQRGVDKKSEAYAVTELVVRNSGWLANKKLNQLRFTDIGVVVLGIEHTDGSYVGTPTGGELIRGEDKLIVYGSMDNLAALEKSSYDKNGEEKHQQLVAYNRAERLKSRDEQRGG